MKLSLKRRSRDLGEDDIGEFTLVADPFFVNRRDQIISSAASGPLPRCLLPSQICGIRLACELGEQSSQNRTVRQEFMPGNTKRSQAKRPAVVQPTTAGSRLERAAVAARDRRRGDRVERPSLTLSGHGSWCSYLP
jgi:hypothetical protein